MIRVERADGWADYVVPTDLLLPYEELPDITDPEWDPRPLIVKKYGPGPTVMAVGVQHSTEVGGENYSAVINAMSDFSTFASGARIVICEGSKTPLVLDGRQAYAEHSERGLAALASHHWKTSLCYESKYITPLGQAADRMLELGFTKDELATYFFYRIAPQWAIDRRPNRPDFRTYVEAHLANKTMPLLQWRDFDFSYQHLVSLCEQTFGKPFDPTDTQFYLRRALGYMLPVDPALPEQEQRMQMLITAYNQLRDRGLAKTVEGAYRQGYSTFLVFGWSHIRTLQPMLEKMMTGPPPQSHSGYIGSLASRPLFPDSKEFSHLMADSRFR